MTDVAEDELKNLEVLNLCMAMHVRHVVESTLVIMATDSLFRRSPEFFATNPANTLPQIALSALEEQSIVHIAEALKDEHKLRPIKTEIRRKKDLFLHRDGVSHPMTVVWRAADRQTFFDENRVWEDLRAALVWDMQQSVNEPLRAAGRTTHNEDIVITTHMAHMVEVIIRLSVTAQGARVVISIEEIPVLLERAKTAFMNFALEHPDGKRR